MKTQNRIPTTKSRARQSACIVPSLRIKLKAAAPEIKNYITALIKENLKLQKEIAKCQASNVTLNNRIKVLEKEQYRPKAVLNIKGPYDK